MVGTTHSRSSCVLALFLVLIVDFAHGQNSYIVTFPCTVLPGQDAVVGVSLFGARSAVTIHAQLQSKTTPANTLSATSAVVQAGAFGQVRVPTPLSPSGTKLTLMVRGTGGLVFSNQTTVTVGKSLSLFVQTDKGAYRPGQTVRMRVVSVLPTLRPFTGTLNVSVEDSSKNRLAQWLNVQPLNGIWNKDLAVSDYPPLGNWTISAVTTGASASAKVEVREYVLPKFSVAVTSVPYIAREDNTDVTVTVKAQYTYGKPVRGSASINLFLNNVYQYCRSGQTRLASIQRKATLSADGTVTATLSRADFLRLFCSESSFSWYANGYRSMVANATVVDQVSGESQSGASSVGLFGYRTSLSIDNTVTQSVFKPGTKYPVRFFYSTPDKKPVNGAKAVVRVSGAGNITSSTTVLTSVNGVIDYIVNVPRGARSLQVEAYPGTDTQRVTYSRQVSVNPSLLKSPSKSYLQLTSAKANFSPGETASISGQASVSSASAFTQLFYHVYSRATLVHHGSASPAAGSTRVDFTVPIQARMGPFAKIVAFFVVSGEFVVDSVSLSVSGVFENNVTVAFDKPQARPNDNVTLSVSTDIGSTVAVAVVDQSALLVRQANTVSVAAVTQALSSYDQSAQRIVYDGPVWALEQAVSFRRRRRRTVLPGPWYYGGSSAAQLLANAGVCVITDFYIPSNGPSNCYSYNCNQDIAFFGGPVPEVQNSDSAAGSAKTSGSTVGQSLAVPDHTRDFFPETWLWEQSVAGMDGFARFNSTVPDSITSWVATAFAMSSTSGLGVAASSAKLRAFQPFFVSLNLPYSVIRSEEMVLQVNVFNYLDTRQETVVTLQATASLEVRGAGLGASATRTISVPAGEARSALFIVIPKSVGRVPLTVTAQSTAAADRVVRQLLVEPEGIAKSYSRGVFIDLSTSSSLTESLSLALPSNVVAGSARATVSVIGDIMGPALSNLDKLLQMPGGCGEQNMVGFAPDVFITRYLTATSQSSPVILAKATLYMMSGYQRELRYWRSDYSFSAFGKRDSSGSLWLTAFVVKSFSQATPYIYVDPQVISKSLGFVVSKQTASGSFPLVGMVHSSHLKGGLQGDVARTAYVLTALVEAKAKNIRLTPTNRLDNAITSAQAYLASKLTLVTDNYTLALSAYALRLSNSPKAAQAIQLLLARADRSGGSMYWHDARQKTVSRSWSPPWRRASSADVELTAYGLLALVQDGNVVEGSKVARWLAAQRNSYGGFDSTQDTVVGLQALAEFAIVVSATPPTMDIRISAQGAATPFTEAFSVRRSNSLVLQQTTDFPVPGTLVLSGSGNGTAVLSVEVFYNVQTDDVIAFDMSTKCSLWKFGERLGATCRYCTHVASSVYANTGMSLLEIGLPSGFVADLESVNKAMVSVPSAGRVETPQRQVVFYLDDVGNADTCVEFDMLQSVIIGKLQPSAVRTLNYYDPSISNADLYSVSSVEIPVCCQCPSCDGCAGMNGTCPTFQTRSSGSGASAVSVSVTLALMCLLCVLLF